MTWIPRRIGDLGRVVTGKTPSTATKEFFDGPYPFITILDMGGGVYIDRTQRTLSDAGAMAVKGSVLPKDAVMMSCIATIGRCGITVRPSVTNQQINSVICNEEVDPRFLYYAFTQLGAALEAAGGGGSVFTNISKSRFESIEVDVPPMDTQLAIAAILWALDDKIELNRRMNGTLEAMAQALFKEWFVDGAKEEWEEKRLEEVADVNWGDTNATKKLYVDSGFTAYSAAGPDGFLPYHDYDRTGIVVSAIGSAGKTYLAMGKWSCIKNTLRFWSTSPQLSTEYLFQATLGVEKWPMRGSVQPFISQGDARAMRVVVPGDGLGARYGEMVRPMYEKIEANKAESRTLAALRDTLLPKLMRGEVRVNGNYNAASISK